MHRYAALVLIAAAVGARAAQPHVIPNVADDAIRIDGRCSEWETIPSALRLASSEQVALHGEHWRGPEDLSAVVHLAWTNAALLLAVDGGELAVPQVAVHTVDLVHQRGGLKRGQRVQRQAVGVHLFGL